MAESKRKPVRGWRKGPLCSWELRIGSVSLIQDINDRVRLVSEKEEIEEREDAEDWALAAAEAFAAEMRKRIAKRRAEA